MCRADDFGGSSGATVHMTVGPQSPPTAVQDVLNTAKNAPATVQVLLNDTDPEGDALTVSAPLTAARAAR